VLDDAVVDDDDLAGAVGMRVLLRRAAVGCPACVADPGRPAEGVLAEECGEPVELADAAPDLHVMVVEDGEAGRVVTPVLELPEPAHQDRARVARPDVADDATHGSAPPPRRGARGLGLPAMRAPGPAGLDRRLGRL